MCTLLIIFVPETIFKNNLSYNIRIGSIERSEKMQTREVSMCMQQNFFNEIQPGVPRLSKGLDSVLVHSSSAGRSSRNVSKELDRASHDSSYHQSFSFLRLAHSHNQKCSRDLAIY